MKNKIFMRISAFVLAVVVFFISVPITARASNDTDTESTNIVKLLDMILNKCGVSAAPNTIQDIYNYMQDTVVDGAQVFFDLVDSAYSNVSDYVAACKNKVSDAASNIPDSAKSLMNGYLDYMGRCTDTVANFKAGYAKGANFRDYILSYVTDQDGNQLSGPIKKGGKYNIKGGLVNMVRQNLDAYIDEYEGYWMIPSFTYADLPATQFSKKENYEKRVKALKTLSDGYIVYEQTDDTTFSNSFIRIDNVNLIGSKYKTTGSNSIGYVDYYYFRVYAYNDNWEFVSFSFQVYTDSVNLSDESLYKLTGSGPLQVYPYLLNPVSGRLVPHFYTSDGRAVKVWKSLDAFKQSTINKSNIYYASGYGNFDPAGNNGISFDGQYYINQDYSHTTIQNNIDNSSEVNETIINNIVNNYITNNYYGDTSGEGGGGGSGGGNWFLDLIKGIPELLAALVDAIVNIADSVGDLFESLFARFFVPSEEAKTELKEAAETKFNFVTTSHTDIVNISERLETMGSNAPTITFPLSKTPLVKYGVGDVTVSFEWFEPYRYGFHTLLSSIMWIMFLFNQYFGLKNLIRGTSSFSGSLSAPEIE